MRGAICLVRSTPSREVVAPLSHLAGSTVYSHPAGTPLPPRVEWPPAWQGLAGASLSLTVFMSWPGQIPSRAAG